MALDSFIEQHVTDPAIHRDRSMRLGEGALSAAYPRTIVTQL